MYNRSTMGVERQFPNEEINQNLFVFHSNVLKSDFEPEIHRHDFYELAWVSEGEALFFSDFNRYDVQGGTLLFVTPGQVHTLATVEGNFDSLESFVIGFKPTIFGSHGQSTKFLLELPFYFAQATPYLSVPQESVPFFDSLFFQMYDRYINTDQVDEELLLSYLKLLLGESKRLYALAPKAVQLTAADHLVQQFMLLVDQHLLERFQVTQYAEMLGITANHLVKTLRVKIGKTPGQIIQDRLVLEAQRVLIHTAMPNKEIAYFLAFNSPSQFGKWFKQATGTSPGQFRQNFNIN